MGWLADLLTTINNPVAKLIPEGTMYRDLADHFGAVGTNKWYEAGGDVITGDKPFNWETISEGLQGAGKSTPTGRAVDNFAWKVVGPIIAGYYGTPVAGAAAAGLGQKLAGESDRDAAIAAGTAYVGGKLGQLGKAASTGAKSSAELSKLGIGNPGSYGGSSASITPAVQNTGTLANVLNVAKNALVQGIDKTAQDNGQQSFGLNKFSYLTGIIGDALNPTSPLRGVGQSLAQQNQFSRATAANKKKQSIASSLIKSIMLGETAPTEKGKEGLSDFRIVAGKDGRPVMKMEYDLSNDDLAAAYNPQEDNILTPEMQSALARQEGQVSDTEMSIAQLLAKQKADSQKAAIEAAEKADKAKADAIRMEKQDRKDAEYLELAKRNAERADESFAYRKERDEKLDARTEAKDKLASGRQEIFAALDKRRKELDIELKRLELEAKQNPNKDTARRLTEAQLLSARTTLSEDLAYLNADEPKLRIGNKYKADKVQPFHIHEINERSVKVAPTSTNFAIWLDGRPRLVETRNGRTIGQIYEAAKQAGWSIQQIHDSILEELKQGEKSRFKLLETN